MKSSQFKIVSLILSLLAVGGVSAGIYFLAPEHFQQNNLTTTLFGIGGAGALVLWGLLQLVAPKATAEQPATTKPQPKKPEPKPEPQIPPHAAAVQLLSILQRQGRLIDFLQEDLTPFDDAQIGAAVRNIHEGCQKALKEYFVIEPILKGSEGESITVPAGFNTSEIRLVGNVTGEPPFNGALMHRGWRVKRVNLPQIMKADEKDMILAAAEVEI